MTQASTEAPAQGNMQTQSAAPSNPKPFTLKTLAYGILGSEVSEEPCGGETLGSEVETQTESVTPAGYYETDEFSTWTSMDAEFKEEDCDMETSGSDGSANPSDGGSDPENVLYLEATPLGQGS